ncbi:MAG: glucose-6-phosphate isomerase, partial [Halobacteria archaeon]|nr:glucose-6-phosphate isomerase [Halobacteria archaeon]
VHFLDNVDPDYLRRLLDRIELENTVVSVVSKSGSTAETVANYLVVREAFEDADLEPRDHTVVTTGDASPLRDVGSRRVFDFPGVPGRYSALSVTGLLPAAFAGVNVEEVLEGGRKAEERCARPSIRDNPGYALGGASYALDRKGRSVTVMMPYSERLETFGEWYAQLWAESLGKRETVDGRVVNAGQTPVKSVGVTDQHSLLQLLVEGPDDKLVTFVDVGEGSDEDLGGDVSIPETHDEVHGYLCGSTLSELRAAELDATQASLVEAGKPSLRVKLRDVSPSEVGQLLYTYEVAVAVAGELHGVNPFNQPGVESGKRATYALLGREGYEGEEGRVEEIKETLFEV